MIRMEDDLRHQMNYYKDQLEEYRNRVGENQKKLKRLYPAKDRLQYYKDCAKSNEPHFKGLVDGLDADANWSGEKRNSVRSLMGDSIYWQYRDYTRSVDDALDAVCDEITRLENDCTIRGGAISSFIRHINTLKNEIRKATN